MNSNQAFSNDDLNSMPRVENGTVWINGTMLPNGNHSYSNAYWSGETLVVNEVPSGGQQTTWFYVGFNNRFIGHNGQIDGSSESDWKRALERAQKYRNSSEESESDNYYDDSSSDDDGWGSKIVKWIFKLIWKIITLPFRILWNLIVDTARGN